MPVIDGYTFVMDLQDRGVMRGLKGMKDAMRILKTEMRAGFSEFKAGEGTLSAYNYKVTQSANIIKEYERNIGELSSRLENYKTHLNNLQQSESEAKKHLDDLKNSTTATKKEISEAARDYAQAQRATKQFTAETEKQKTTLDKTKASLASMREQQEKAIQMLAKMKTGLFDYRKQTEAVQKANRAYIDSLRQSGSYFKANRSEIKGLKVEQQSLSSQYKAEKQVLAQLESQQAKLIRQYDVEKSKLATAKTNIAYRTNELQKATLASGKNSEQAQKAKAALEKETEAYEKQKRVLSGFPEKLSSVSKEYSEQAVKANTAANRLGVLNQKLGTTKFGTFKAQIHGFNSAIGQMNQKFKESTSHTREWASSLKSSFLAVSAGVGVMGAGVGKAVSMAANLQQSWITTKNILNTGASSAKEAASEVKKVGIMQRDAASYSKQYGVSQKEIADQYTELVKRGYDANASIGSMKSMLEAARASGDDYADVVQNTASVLDAFNLRQNKTSKQVIESSQRVTNAMAYSADMTATDFKNMGEAMKFASVGAAQAGQSVEVTTAAIGELSNAGLEGSLAGTGFRKMMTSLVKPTKGAADALASVHLQLKDFKTQSGALKQLPEIMSIINKHVDHLGRAEKGAFFKAVFGATGMNAAMILSQTSKDFADLVEKEKKAEKDNYVHNLAKKNMASTKMQLKQLEMAGQDLAITVGAKVLPSINKVAKAFGNWVVSKEGQASINGVAKAIGNTSSEIGKHSSDIIMFFQGIKDGSKNALNSLKSIGNWFSHLPGVSTAVKNVKAFFSWMNTKMGGNKNKNAFVRFAGQAVGAIATIFIPLKLLKKSIQGVAALGKDVGSLFNWRKGNKLVQERNAYMERMIKLQEESINLTKQQIGLDQKNTKPTSGATGGSSSGDALDTILDNVGGSGKEGKAVKEAEKAADKVHMGFFKRLRLKLKGGSGLTFAEVFRGVKPAAEAAGTTASKGFFGKFKSLLSKINLKNWKIFGGAAKAGAEVGAKASTGFLGKIKGSFWKLLGLGKSAMGFFDKGFLGLGLAGNALDIIGGIRKKNSPEQSRQLGSGVGGAMGAGIGAALGSIIPGIGTLVGAGLGQLIGTTAGRYWPELTRGFGVAVKNGINVGKDMWTSYCSFVKGTGTALGKLLKGDFKGAWETVRKGGEQAISGVVSWLDKHGLKGIKNWTSKSISLIQKGDWKGAGHNTLKSFQSAWSGFSSWWDKNILGKTKKSSSTSSKKSTPTAAKIKSLGGNHYSKKDIANVKAMNKAITAYTSSLSKLKATIKKNDPTKELNAMNKALVGHTSGWTKAATPIKKIGEAFSTLAKFTSSMAKKDAFQVFNKDLPDLDKTLQKHSTSIKKGLEKLNDTLKSGKKSNGLIDNSKALADAFDKLKSKVNKLKDPISSVSSSFGKLQKAMKALVSGKTTEFEKLGKGLDKMQTTFYHVLKGKNSVPNLVERLTNSFTKNKLDSVLNKIESPLKKLKNDLTTIKKPLDSISTSIYVINKDLAGWNKKNPLDAMATGFKNLDKVLGSVSGKNGIASKLEAISKAFGTAGKKKSTGFVGAMKEINSPLKTMTSNFQKLQTPITKFASAMTKLGNGKKNPINNFATSLKSLGSVLGGKNKLVKDLQDLSSAIGGVSKGKGKKSTSGLVAAFSSLATPAKKVSDAFSKLNKPMSAISKSLKLFSGKRNKNNPLMNMAKGFEKLNDVFKSKKSNVTTKMQEFVEALQGGKGKKAKSLPTLLKDTNKPLSKLASYFKELPKPLKNSSAGMKAFSKALNSFKSKKSNSISAVTSAVKSLYTALTKYPFGEEMSDQAEIATKALSGNSFAKRFVSAVKQIEKKLDTVKSSFNKDWSKLWKELNTPVKKGLTTVEKTTATDLKKVQKERGDFQKTFLSQWKSFITSVQTTFRTGLNTLPGYASSAMRSVISRMNAGIGGVNSVIGQFGGDKKLSTIRYANGTEKGHPGGHMLINDSAKPHWKELVKFPGKPWTMFSQKDTFIPNAPKGTQVLNGDDTYSLMAKHGISAYADGTLDPEQALKMMDEIDKNPLKALKKAFYSKASFATGSAVVRDFGSALSNAFLNAIKNPFKKAIDEFGGSIANPGGAGVARWRPYIEKAAKMMHVNLTSAGLAKILSNIAHESNGSPTVVNTWDSNARAGHPSIGLVQFIQPTFDRYAIRGHNNIRSGFDQLLALFNDSNWFNDIAPGGGWGPSGAPRFADGGFSYKHQLAEISEGNKLEAIIPMDLSKRPRALELMSQVIARMQADSGKPLIKSDNSETNIVSQKLDSLIGLLEKLLSQDQTIETTVTLDSRQIAKAIAPYNRIENTKAEIARRLGLSGM